jgi:hypothetical protein
MPAEAPILRSLGREVFIPKIIPDHDAGFRRAAVTYEHDAAPQLPESALSVPNRHDIYERAWPLKIQVTANRYFDAVVSNFSYYTTALLNPRASLEVCTSRERLGVSSLTHIRNLVRLARIKIYCRSLRRWAIASFLARDTITLPKSKDVELRRRAHATTVPLPIEFYRNKGAWHSGGAKAVFVCPAIVPGGYYGKIYDDIKRDFADVPPVIFGRQVQPIEGPAFFRISPTKNLQNCTQAPRYSSTRIRNLATSNTRH